MPAVLISPPAKFSSELATGAPLAGGKLYTYAGGTSTPAATYTDSTGSIANTNPVILDARGEANVWLEQGVSYKYVLKDADDVLVWTVDNINGQTAGGGVTTLFGNGTVTAPSISFLNSTGMGFYRISNNVLGLATAGANAVVVDASQNVGIGVTPTVKLDVNGGGKFASGLTVTAGGLTVSAGGLTVTGDSSITGNTTHTGNLSVTGGEFSSRGFYDQATSQHWKIDSAGRLLNTGSLQPVFHAYRSTSQQTSGTTLVFNAEKLDQGAVYNAATGVFTAPVTGNYIFCASAQLTNATGATVGVQLQLSCSSAGIAAAQSVLLPTATTYTVSVSVVVRLGAGETAQATLNAALSALFVLTVDDRSSFSGALLG